MILSFHIKSSDAVAREIAERFKLRRLELGWSREELGARSDVAVPTLRQFETTGQISLARLLRLAGPLDLLGDFEPIASPHRLPPTLAEIEAQYAARQRKRGRTLTRTP